MIATRSLLYITVLCNLTCALSYSGNGDRGFVKALLQGLYVSLCFVVEQLHEILNNLLFTYASLTVDNPYFNACTMYIVQANR
jgi:hypothetical protein